MTRDVVPFRGVVVLAGLVRPRSGLDDQIRLGLPKQRREIPDLFVRPRLRRWHVLHVALRGARINPLRNGGDLVVAQRPVVLEFLDAHGLVDVPGRHLSIRHARLDRARPRPRLFISGERHRRDRVGPMARFALLLEDRRNVFRERRLRRNVGQGRRGDRHGNNENAKWLPCRAHSKTPFAPSPGGLLPTRHPKKGTFAQANRNTM